MRILNAMPIKTMVSCIIDFSTIFLELGNYNLPSRGNGVQLLTLYFALLISPKIAHQSLSS